MGMVLGLFVRHIMRRCIDWHGLRCGLYFRSDFIFMRCSEMTDRTWELVSIMTRYNASGPQIAALLGVKPQTVWSWRMGRKRVIPADKLEQLIQIIADQNMVATPRRAKL